MGIGIDPAAVLDVVIGLAFLFFLTATLCSAVNEALASWMSWRGKHLKKGVVKLLGSDLAEDFFKDPRIKRLSKDKIREDEKSVKGKKLRLPSYVESRTFAAVALDLLSKDLEDKDLRKAGFTPIEIERIKGLRPGGTLDIADDRLRTLAVAFREARGLASEPISNLQKNLETSFNDTMDRVSGWYKRRTVIVVAVIATVMTVSLNIDTIHVTKTLAKDPERTKAMVDKATGEFEAIAKENKEACKGKTGDEETECRMEIVEELKDQTMASGFPLGWENADQLKKLLDPGREGFELSTSLAKLIGFLITIIAICLGAPFWYQALTKMVPLRATGPKIEDGKGAGGGTSDS